MSHLLSPSARVVSFALAATLALASVAHAQLTPEQAAAMLLNSARKAYNEKNYPFAATKFREYLAKHGNLPDATAARHGLALAVLEGPGPNYNEARDLLQNVVTNKQFPERALALYYLGLAVRGQGLHELQQAEGKPPPEVQNRRNTAKQRFAEAENFFAAALKELEGQAKDAKEPGEAADWSARARCDLAEMQLRQSKAKEAQATTAPLADAAKKSRYGNLGRYYHGYASLLLKDNDLAQKTLSTLAPFNDPVFGSHARYLLARTHHLADERAEAQAHYEGVINNYAAARAEALKRLQQPQLFQNDPVVRAQLEALTRAIPDHVARANFYLGTLLYEGGKFGEARARLTEFLKQFPQSPFRTEAELRIGFCQVQQKEYAEAVKTLQPLIDRDPRLSDQVLFWLGKAQAGAAPDATANAAGHQQAINQALNTLRQAAERAQRVQNEDPEAKTRRGEILLELADQMQQIKQNKEAAGVYNQLLAEKALPEREEEIAQRLTHALQLAGDYNESDQACQRFQQKYPQSTLLPAVLFCAAENAYFRLLAAEKHPNPAERAKEQAKHADEAAKRFQAVIDKFPEFPKVNLARYSLGLTHYRQGELDKAQKAWNDIPAPERGGELALVPYLLADCVLRQVPSAVPEDALAAGKMESDLKTASELLEGFVSAQPKDPQVPDALLKLGLSKQRLASLLAQPPEKAKMLADARAVYERLPREFPKDAAAVQAIVERAKCMAQAGDVNSAINELRRFTADPLKQDAKVAPIALVQLATYLRSQNKAAEAADILAKGLQQHEGNLSKDPERAGWVALLRYHQGVALREAGKLPEARAQFDAVSKLGTNRPEAAEAALRLGQTLKDEGQAKLDQAVKLRGSGKKEDQAKADQLAAEGYKVVGDAVRHLEGQAEQFKKQEARQDVTARLLYEAAWGTRVLAEPEIAAARKALAQELVKKLGPAASKFPPPKVPIDKVPLQPAEKKARAIYQGLIDAFPEQPVAVEARFELAELLAQRNEFDAAVKLLQDVLDKEPSQELTDKVRLRLGGIHAAKGDLKSALSQFDAVARNPKSPLLGWAHYRAGEAHLDASQFDEAAKRLLVFRDQGPFQNLSGLSDRALLRLGFAFACKKEWDQSRVSYERLVNAFPNSPWAEEARYGIGWALQQQKNHDAAVNFYSQVTARTAGEVAAKAQFQIGQCRLEQKRPVDAVNALLVVPYTYDYPELNAAARYEAARAYVELRQNDQALRQLRAIVQEFPGTPWAEAAKERIKALQAN